MLSCMGRPAEIRPTSKSGIPELEASKVRFREHPSLKTRAAEEQESRQPK